MVSIIQWFKIIIFLTCLMFFEMLNNETVRRYSRRNVADDGDTSRFLCLTPFSWSRDILIHLWFFIFSFYEVIWMYFYLKGTQPWHYSIKWFTCNHYLMRGEAHEGKIICNNSSLLFTNQGKVISLLVVCSICWIKF